MNYMITRTIIMLILILGFIIYLKICKKIISKKNINPMFIKKVNLKVVIFLYLIIWVILNIIPFENYFIKFKTIEDNINYFFTNPKIVKKFVYDDYAYVNVLHGEVTDYFMYLEKKNGSWEFSSLFPRNHGYHKSIKSIDFQLIELKNKNSIGIKITTFSKDNKIKDSLNSKVYTNPTKKNNESYIIINKKISKKDYKIFINKKEYKPLK